MPPLTAVIKVEPPAGDLMRAWPPRVDGHNQYCASLKSCLESE